MPAIVRILRRDVALVIVVKVLLIAALYLLFFSPAQRPAPGSGEVAERLLPSGAPP